MDGDGFAILMKFPSLQSVISYIRRFVQQKGCETRTLNSQATSSLSLCERSFELLPIFCCP